MGLTATESRALTNNRSALLSGMEPGDVIDYLYSYELVSQMQFEEIKSLPTRQKKCEALLTILQRAQSDHYALFVRVLEKTKQGHLAKLLRPSSSRYGPPGKVTEPPATSKSKDVTCGVSGESFDSYGPRSSIDYEQPSESLDFDRSTAILDVNVVPCTNPIVLSLLSQQRGGCSGRRSAAAVYRITQPSRGRALLLCNTAFDPTTGLAPRPSAENDAVNVGRLLGALGFAVRLVRNATREELVRAIDSERREAAHADLGAFALYVSSHGEEGAVYGKDGRRLLLEDVFEALDGRGCPSLAGKPKLIVVEASQGQLLDRVALPAPLAPAAVHSGCTSDSKDSAEVKCEGDDIASVAAERLPAAPTVTYPNIGLQLKRFTIPAAPAVCGFGPLPVAADSRGMHGDGVSRPLSSSLPTKADFVVALSAFPGYASFRHQKQGCWFSRALVEAFAKHACDEHVIQLLRRVRRMVLQAETDLGYKQVCITYDTLLKNFYLFPGVDESLAGKEYS